MKTSLALNAAALQLTLMLFSIITFLPRKVATTHTFACYHCDAMCAAEGGTMYNGFPHWEMRSGCLFCRKILIIPYEGGNVAVRQCVMEVNCIPVDGLIFCCESAYCNSANGKQESTLLMKLIYAIPLLLMAHQYRAMPA